MDDDNPTPPEAVHLPSMLLEVRYSLPELLAEIENERKSASFAMEKLEQAEIGKLFKTKKSTRVKPKT